MHNLTDYIQIFQEVLGIEHESEIFAAECGDTKEWDSYTHIELMAALEERFQIRFEGKDVLKFVSFDAGVAILKEKGVDFEEDNT